MADGRVHSGMDGQSTPSLSGDLGDWRADSHFKTRLLVGDAGVERLAAATVMVIGVGGVGGSCAEALARSGVGTLLLVDDDVVSPTNLNRQAVAFTSTLGRPKAEVAAAMARDIDPSVRAVSLRRRIMPSDVAPFFENDVPHALGSAVPLSYVIDCQDTVATKIELACYCEEHAIPLVSSMGTGNKLHPELFRIDDIYRTSVDPLCKVVRRELRRRGVAGLEVLCSTEGPRKTVPLPGAERRMRTYVGTMSYVPPAAGLMLAGHAIRKILDIEE